MVFAMLSITNLTGVVIFGLLYGFWSGSCPCHCYSISSVHLNFYILDTSLIPTLLAQLSINPGEHGYCLFMCNLVTLGLFLIEHVWALHFPSLEYPFLLAHQ